ncbi:hypothetical protein I4200191B4_18190 [Pseudoflavonifractor gallinarum]
MDHYWKGTDMSECIQRMTEAGITGGCGRAGKKCDHWEWKGDKHGEFETTDR